MQMMKIVDLVVNGVPEHDKLICVLAVVLCERIDDRARKVRPLSTTQTMYTEAFLQICHPLVTSKFLHCVSKKVHTFKLSAALSNLNQF